MTYEEILNKIAQKTAEINPEREGDYTGIDGLLYCGKCHTQKQSEIEINGHKMIVPAMCKCETEKYKDEQQSLRNHEKEIRINKMRYNCFPSCKGKCNSEKDMKSWTFKNDKGYNSQAVKTARKFVDNFETFFKCGQGLMFLGDVGVGKLILLPVLPMHCLIMIILY